MNKIEHFHATGKSRYMRIIRRSDGYIWDWNASAFVENPEWGLSAVRLQEHSYVKGYYTAVIPAIGAGKFFALIYDEATIPLDTDVRVQIISFEYDGWKIVDNPAIALETTVANADPDGSDADGTFTLAKGSANDDEYNNMVIAVSDVSGGVTASRRITDYTGATKKITVDYPFEFPIADGDYVRIWADTYSTTAGAAAAGEIADAVWEESQTEHVTAGSMGASQKRKGDGMRIG